MTIESSSPNLRPLRMGELLDRIVRLYRQNFLTFIGIVALVQVPLSIIQLLVTLSTISTLTQFSTTTTSDFGLLTQATNGSFATLIPTILGFILVQGVGTAALTRAVANNYMGQKTGVVESYQQIGKVWVSLIGALIFAGLFGVVLLIWWIIPCIGWITGIGALIFYGWVVVPLIAPVIVLERQGASGAIQRIWSLVRHRFWWVFGFAFLLLVFNYLLIAGPTAVVSLIFQFGIGDPLSPTNDQLVLQSVVQTVVNFIFSLLYLPLQLTGFTLLYFDLRVRTEGFDLAVLASESGVGGSMDAVGTIETAPKGDSKFGVTWTELGYFAVISIGFAVLYFGLVAVLLGVAGGIGGAF
jgi:hypothetical protein